jgi:hypothetical protein
MRRLDQHDPERRNPHGTPPGEYVPSADSLPGTIVQSPPQFCNRKNSSGTAERIKREMEEGLPLDGVSLHAVS